MTVTERAAVEDSKATKPRSHCDLEFKVVSLPGQPSFRRAWLLDPPVRQGGGLLLKPILLSAFGKEALPYDLGGQRGCASTQLPFSSLPSDILPACPTRVSVLLLIF